MRRRFGVFIVGVVIGLVGCTSAETRLARGDDCYIRGNYIAALEQYQIARRKDPGLFEIDQKIFDTKVRIYLQRGDLAVDRCEWIAAERAYEEVRRMDPGHPDIAARFDRLSDARAQHHFELGQQQLASGDAYLAIQEFERCLAVDPGHAPAREALGRAEAELAERKGRAERTYRDGVAARDSGDLDEAIRRFQETLELDPRHPGAAIELESAQREIVLAWIRRGDDAGHAENWADAISYYRSALELDPSRHDVRKRLRRARREQDAAEWAARGADAMQREEWALAFECYDHALQLTSTPGNYQNELDRARQRHADDLYDGARIHEREGRYREALAVYREILCFVPDHADVRDRGEDLATRLESAEREFVRGCAAEVACDFVTAHAAFRSCVEFVPGYRDAEMRLRVATKNVDLARSLYERACDAASIGQKRRARILFEECLLVTQPFEDCHSRLAAIVRGREPSEHRSPAYDRLCSYQTSRDFVSARDILPDCEAEAPDLDALARRRSDIESAIARARASYDAGCAADDNGDLEPACGFYRETLQICAPFKDTKARLQKCERTLARLREAEQCDREQRWIAARDAYAFVLKTHPRHARAKKRRGEIVLICDELEAEGRECDEAEKRGEYRIALSIAVKIRRRCRDFHGIDARIEKLEVAAHYEDGELFEAQGDYDRAAKCFERAEKRNPNFKDVGKRAKNARARSRGRGR